MAVTGLSSLALWAVIALIFAGTLLARLSILVVFGRLSSVPHGVERLLTLVAPAALAALVAPSFVVIDGSLALSPANERLLAGVVAALVAWRTENLLATVAAGMAVVWVAGLL